MNSSLAQESTVSIRQGLYPLKALFAGALIPFGFAPFHLPGLAILGLSLLFAELISTKKQKQALWTGFSFGLGFMGIGVSWIYVSIHNYGHLNAVFSAAITTAFIAYNALFFSLTALLFNFSIRNNRLVSCLAFSALWTLIEYLRAHFLGGFPWLLLGFGQIDTPLAHLLPIIGVYGVSFLTVFSATCLVFATQSGARRLGWLITFIAVLLLPTPLKSLDWSHPIQKPLAVSVIQANLSMRDKWDEAMFWQIVKHYQQQVNALLGKKQVIVLPESAIPIPEQYVGDFISTTRYHATQHRSTVLLGIPQTANQQDTEFYNTLVSLGVGEGTYMKQHLVPFGEYIPAPFAKLMRLFELPLSNMRPGAANQPLVLAQQYPIATLICYEVAYPPLLRKQLPEARWIVSISDDGWFGHSFAMYQQLQMSQVLSKLSARYQIVANNDGLSSIINPQGDLIHSLPSFSAGILNGTIYPAEGQTPWVLFGDQPILFLSLFISLIAFFKKRRYPYQSSEF